MPTKSGASKFPTVRSFSNSLGGLLERAFMPIQNSSSSVPQLVYTADEAAAILKVSQKTVYRLVERKMLHAIKALRHLRISHASLEKFVANNDGGCQ